MMYFDHGTIPLVLPDFSNSTTPTGDLRSHMRSFFHLSLSQSFLIQMYVVTAIIGVLILMGAAVVVWRIREGSLWVFRIQPASRSDYSLLVPNTVMTFVLIEAMFGVVFLAYVWCQLSAFQSGYNLAYQGPWILLVWWLLYAGAWFGSVGTFYASPGVLSRRVIAPGRFDIASLIPGAGVCNLISVGVPLLVFISTGIIAIPLGRHWHDAYREWQSLDTTLALVDATNAIPAGAIEASLMVWQNWTQTMWYIRVGFFVWGCWAALLFMFYLPSGAKLALTLHKQFEESRKAEEELQLTLQRRRKERAERGQGSNSDTTAAAAAAPAPVWKLDQEVLSFEEEGPATRRRNREALEEAKRAAESTFYPPIKATKTHIDSNSNGPTVNVLRKTLINLVIMWGSISTAVLSYAILCFWNSVHLYKASQEGPDQLARVYMIYNLVAAWLACIFGGLNFVWVTSRTFEPVIEGLQLKQGKSNEALKSITTFFSTSRAPNHPAFDGIDNVNAEHRGNGYDHSETYTAPRRRRFRKQLDEILSTTSFTKSQGADIEASLGRSDYPDPSESSRRPLGPPRSISFRAKVESLESDTTRRGGEAVDNKHPVDDREDQVDVDSPIVDRESQIPAYPAPLQVRDKAHHHAGPVSNSYTRTQRTWEIRPSSNSRSASSRERRKTEERTEHSEDPLENSSYPYPLIRIEPPLSSHSHSHSRSHSQSDNSPREARRQMLLQQQQQQQQPPPQSYRQQHHHQQQQPQEEEEEQQSRPYQQPLRLNPGASRPNSRRMPTARYDEVHTVHRDDDLE